MPGGRREIGSPRHSANNCHRPRRLLRIFVSVLFEGSASAPRPEADMSRRSSYLTLDALDPAACSAAMARTWWIASMTISGRS